MFAYHLIRQCLLTSRFCAELVLLRFLNLFHLLHFEGDLGALACEGAGPHGAARDPSVLSLLRHANRGLGKGGKGTIFVNDKKVAEGRIEQTQPMMFSGDEGADVGEDGETPVVENYGIPAPYKFTGKISRVTIDLEEMKKAEKAEEDKLRAQAGHKKALSD